jgi:tripartite-type tricarboxylate transporter receptor subunit TctC
MAAEFQTKPLQFIVPFAPGAITDTLARIIGKQLSQALGLTIIVENKPGGGTVVGTAAAARATPDGHTFLIVANSFVITAKLRTGLPYQGIHAFAPVARITTSPQVIAVNSSSSHTNLKSWLDAARAKPSSMSIATNGPATAQHIAVELVMRAAGIQLVYVPFSGGNLAVNALLGGHVDAALSNFGDMAAHFTAGKLRPLAVTTTQRVDALRDVPTVAELGYPGYEALAWFGMVAPLGTPRDLVARVSDAIRKALNEPEVVRLVSALNLQPNYQDPAEFASYIDQQFSDYARVIDSAKIKED